MAVLQATGDVVVDQFIAAVEVVEALTIVPANTVLRAQPDVTGRILKNAGDFVVRQTVVDVQGLPIPLAIEDADPALRAEPKTPIGRLECTCGFVVGESLFGGEFLEGVAIEPGDTAAVAGAPDVAMTILKDIPHKPAAEAVSGVEGSPVAGLSGRLPLSDSGGSGVELHTVLHHTVRARLAETLAQILQ